MKKRLLALLPALAVVMTAALSACGGSKDETPTPKPAETAAAQTGETETKNETQTEQTDDSEKPASAPTGTAGQALYRDGYRVIRIASWYDYGDVYMSNQSPDDLELAKTNPESYAVRYARLKEIEEKYKVKFEQVRMTFDGTALSLDEGVLSGKPEVDLYELDVQQGIPAALNDYLYAVEDLTTPDADVFTTQQVFFPINVPSLDKTFLFARYSEDPSLYPLGFNWTLLKSKGLENPQDLWDRGEWTWETLIDYATKTTDLGANPPVYGYTGLWTNAFDMFLRSNNANVAGTPEGGLTSTETGEVIDMFKRLYQDLKVARPWNTDDWESNNRFVDGSAAFFTAAAWIFNTDSSNYGGGVDYPATYEFGIVPWPVGPHGDKAKNFQNYVAGNSYGIPKGVEDPWTVYNAWVDLNDWYGGDFANTKTYDVIDPDESPLSWSGQQFTAAANGNEELAEKSVELALFMKDKVSFDPWGNLGITSADAGNFSMVPIMDGTMTPAQLQETYKQPLADALKTIYK